MTAESLIAGIVALVTTGPIAAVIVWAIRTITKRHLVLLTRVENTLLEMTRTMSESVNKIDARLTVIEHKIGISGQLRAIQSSVETGKFKAIEEEAPETSRPSKPGRRKSTGSQNNG